MVGVQENFDICFCRVKYMPSQLATSAAAARRRQESDRLVCMGPMTLQIGHSNSGSDDVQLVLAVAEVEENVRPDEQTGLWYPVLMGTPVLLDAGRGCLTLPAFLDNGGVYGFVPVDDEEGTLRSLEALAEKLSMYGCLVVRRDAAGDLYEFANGQRLVVAEEVGPISEGNAAPSQLAVPSNKPLPCKLAVQAASVAERGGNGASYGIRVAGYMASMGIEASADALKRSGIVPQRSKPLQVSEKTQGRVAYARSATRGMVEVASGMVNEFAGVVSGAVGGATTAAVKIMGTQGRFPGVILVGGAVIGAWSSVFLALADASDACKNATCEAGAGVVGHRYGPQAQETARNALHIVGNLSSVQSAVTRKVVTTTVATTCANAAGNAFCQESQRASLADETEASGQTVRYAALTQNAHNELRDEDNDPPLFPGAGKSTSGIRA